MPVIDDTVMKRLLEEFRKLPDYRKNKVAYTNSDEMANVEKKSKERKVQLMTIHGSKGLEFEHVFIVGAVNGMIPSLHGELETIDKHEQCKNTNIEEERRLFYVAVTRAKECLTISSSKFIHRFGSVSEYERTMLLDGLEHLYKVKKVD